MIWWKRDFFEEREKRWRTDYLCLFYIWWIITRMLFHIQMLKHLKLPCMHIYCKITLNTKNISGLLLCVRGIKYFEVVFWLFSYKRSNMYDSLPTKHLPFDKSWFIKRLSCLKFASGWISYLCLHLGLGLGGGKWRKVQWLSSDQKLLFFDLTLFLNSHDARHSIHLGS